MTPKKNECILFLFFGEKQQNMDDNLIFNLGCYYELEQNYDEMKKCYLVDIERGNDNAMFNLGCYYDKIEKNYDEMKKYYLMAIEKGNDEAMLLLGEHYDYNEENYDLSLIHI